MFDFHDYYQKLQEILKQRVPLWQAVIIKTDGSTPAKPGMHLAVPLNGNPIGNLGGGNLEYIVIKMIREKRPAKPLTKSFTLDANGLPLNENSPRLASSPQESVRTEMICGGNVEVFIEPLFSAFSLNIIGGGHCGKALAKLASLVNFQVTVIDNRPEVLVKEEFPPSCSLLVNDYSNIESVIDFNPDCLIVIMTYGHVHDKHVLELCLRKPFYYLGMIGSEKKVAETLAKLRNEGFTEEEIAKVHAPVGISIGSQTPYEIAVSIVAELIRERNTRSS